MRIYTRTGDGGETGLYGGGRARKGDLRIEALGAVDEANAALGLARTNTRQDQALDPLLERLQHRLFDLGAGLAQPDGGPARIAQSDVEAREQAIDRLEQDLEPLRAFILPGGSDAGAALHLARTIARRAERAVVRLADAGEAVDPLVLTYLNRMSDLLFVAARHANRAEGDIAWRKLSEGA
jgi:cob(I)alamin adenosyltransferase